MVSKHPLALSVHSNPSETYNPYTLTVSDTYCELKPQTTGDDLALKNVFVKKIIGVFSW